MELVPPFLLSLPPCSYTPEGTEPQSNCHRPFSESLGFLRQLAWWGTWGLSAWGGGGEAGPDVAGQMGSLWGAEFRDWELSLALLCGLWWVPLALSKSTPPPFLSPPAAVLPSSARRQKQLCTLAASAVPTAVLHCSVPGVIKYLGGCCRPLYHGQKCHVLRFGFHWVLVHVSRKLW